MAEGDGLLNRYTLSRCIEGSNPSVSAITLEKLKTNQWVKKPCSSGLHTCLCRLAPQVDRHRAMLAMTDVGWQAVCDGELARYFHNFIS